METRFYEDDDEQEYQPNKVVLGIRCHPDLVLHLSKRAKEIGTNRSAYSETLLLTAEANLDQIEILLGKLDRAKLDLAKSKLEADNLRVEVKNQNSKLTIFNDPQLLALYGQIKGRKDVIKSPDGKTLTMTYNSPEDVIKAMIYSFTLKSK